MFEEYDLIPLPQNPVLSTDGSGLWSDRVASVPCTGACVYITHDSPDRYWGELRILFDMKDWSIYDHGLVYTDDKFLDELREYFRSVLGFSEEACQNIDYSEQGMQGGNFVSFDVEPPFIDEFIAFPGVESSA